MKKALALTRPTDGGSLTLIAKSAKHFNGVLPYISIYKLDKEKILVQLSNGKVVISQEFSLEAILNTLGISQLDFPGVLVLSLK